MEALREMRGIVLRGRQRAISLRLSPPQLLILGFAAAIAAGTLLLLSPFAAAGRQADFLTALFTATSAVCVTGLVVVDTGTFWSSWGQAIILLLIQTGGLGVMTMGTLFAILLGKRIGFRERLVIRESLNNVNVAGVVRLVRSILLYTLAIEAAFALILGLRFVAYFGWERGMWFGLFHAVSAFNNAGFDLMGGFRSLTRFVGDPVVTLGVALPVILGGLGFAVAVDLFTHRRWRKLSLHSKFVLVLTFLLIVFGMLIFLALERNHALAGLTPGAKIGAAFFHAVTPRTAGFSTVEVAKMYAATQFFIIVLMFIGASPGSTGGGIKTTTFGALGLAVLSLARGKEDAELFGRRIPKEQIYRALGVFLTALTVVTLATTALLVSEKRDFLALLFETVSAFGTVGLSTGVTPELTPFGKVVLILTMFIGRVGPLTVAFALALRPQRGAVRYPEEKLMIG
ncbi:MAG: Potassium uptake protein, TrkH family [Clostridia bacterium 62_21]|nr:MAG: Potassium uptake protein, TrkH family [Clostridia bacterium 62_21]